MTSCFWVWGLMWGLFVCWVTWAVELLLFMDLMVSIPWIFFNLRYADQSALALEAYEKRTEGFVS